MLAVLTHGDIERKEITMANIPPRPKKVRINMKTGKKEEHVFTDEEILEFYRTGKITIDENTVWQEVKD